MAKRERAASSALTTTIDQFRQAGQPIKPVVDLDEAALAHFNRIITDREAASWSPNHLVIACNLAKTYAAIDELWADIAVEGYTTVNDRGTVVQNAKVTTLNTMTQTMQALNRTLGLSASQRGLSGEHQQKRNNASRQINDLNAETDGHSLLA